MNKKTIQSRYNETAEFYDRRYKKIQRGKYQLIFQNISINSTQKILDIGCGTGNLFSFLRKNKCIKYGIDFSINSLKKLQKSIDRTRIIHIICADIEYLPFKASQFDFIFAITILQNLTDPKKSLRELKNICKINGFEILSLLKKKFPLEHIETLLNEVQIRPLKIINDELCEDIIVICQNEGSIR